MCIIHNYCVCVCVCYSADILLSAALKVPPAHDTVLQALVPSAKVKMQAIFLYTCKRV